MPTATKAPATTKAATTTKAPATATKATGITFEPEQIVMLATALKQFELAEAASVPQRPQILVRISRRIVTEKELENVGAIEKANGLIAKISHSELSQNRLITTVIDSDEMAIQDVPFSKGELADYRCIIPMTDTSPKNPIIAILADISMAFHAMKDGEAVEGGGVSFAVVLEADSFDIEEAILDGKMEVVPYGNIKISQPQALPSSRKVDLKSKMDEVKASKAKQAEEASTIRDQNRRNRLGTSTGKVEAMTNALQNSESSMGDLTTADS